MKPETFSNEDVVMDEISNADGAITGIDAIYDTEEESAKMPCIIEVNDMMLFLW